MYLHSDGGRAPITWRGRGAETARHCGPPRRRPLAAQPAFCSGHGPHRWMGSRTMIRCTAIGPLRGEEERGRRRGAAVGEAGTAAAGGATRSTTRRRVLLSLTCRSPVGRVGHAIFIEEGAGPARPQVALYSRRRLGRDGRRHEVGMAVAVAPRVPAVRHHPVLVLVYAACATMGGGKRGARTSRDARPQLPPNRRALATQAACPSLHCIAAAATHPASAPLPAPERGTCCSPRSCARLQGGAGKRDGQRAALGVGRACRT